MIGNKVLCICAWGNSRSVALAWLLKDKYHKEALACGMAQITPATLRMLADWADTIILTTLEATHPMLDEYKDKVLIWDVGRDKYFQPYLPELIAQYETYYANS